MDMTFFAVADDDVSFPYDFWTLLMVFSGSYELNFGNEDRFLGELV